MLVGVLSVADGWDDLVLTHEHLAQEQSAACPIEYGAHVEIGGEIEASSLTQCAAHPGSHLAVRVSSKRTLARRCDKESDKRLAMTTSTQQRHRD
jgi:hypothetical protein